MTVRDEFIAEMAEKYPMGSRWRHGRVGSVTVTGHGVWSSPPDSYCGVTYGPALNIVDDNGEPWTTYFPWDLLPGWDK